MSGVSTPNLMDAVTNFLGDPSRANARKVDDALSGLPNGVDDAVWFIIGVTQELQGDLAQEKLVREKLESILRDAVKPTIINNNVQQQGGQNAAQTGSGSQTISGESQGVKDDRE